jgi:hypothetical protein
MSLRFVGIARRAFCRLLARFGTADRLVERFADFCVPSRRAFSKPGRIPGPRLGAVPSRCDFLVERNGRKFESPGERREIGLVLDFRRLVPELLPSRFERLPEGFPSSPIRERGAERLFCARDRRAVLVEPDDPPGRRANGPRPECEFDMSLGLAESLPGVLVGVGGRRAPRGLLVDPAPEFALGVEVFGRVGPPAIGERVRLGRFEFTDRGPDRES